MAYRHSRTPVINVKREYVSTRRQHTSSANGVENDGLTPDTYFGGVELQENGTTPGEHFVPDDVYVDKMENILSAHGIGVPPEPSCISKNVFVGTSAQMENLDLLKRLKITHILNVAGLPLGLRAKRTRLYQGTPIHYEEFPIDDREGFEIWPFFSTAYTYINTARYNGGRVMICDSGVSRSGAIAISFLIRDGLKLLDATQHLKNLRRVTLSNRSFMEQLVTFARTYGLLDSDPGIVYAPRYGRKLDHHRLKYAHLPTRL